MRQNSPNSKHHCREFVWRSSHYCCFSPIFYCFSRPILLVIPTLSWLHPNFVGCTPILSGYTISYPFNFLCDFTSPYPSLGEPRVDHVHGVGIRHLRLIRLNGAIAMKVTHGGFSWEFLCVCMCYIYLYYYIIYCSICEKYYILHIIYYILYIISYYIIYYVLYHIILYIISYYIILDHIISY